MVVESWIRRDPDPGVWGSGCPGERAPWGFEKEKPSSLLMARQPLGIQKRTERVLVIDEQHCLPWV